MKQPPSTLTAITLSQWVGYQNTYGQALDDRLVTIMRMPEGEERSEQFSQYNADYHVKNYAYYTGTSLDAIDKIGLYDVIKMQGSAFIALKQEQIKLDVNRVFDWIGEKWQIKPIYPATLKLTKAHYDMVTDIALIWSDLQDGKHEALYELCAAYMRKLNEPYTSELLEERKDLMKSLPLNMALCVKIYNENSIKQLLQQ